MGMIHIEKRPDGVVMVVLDHPDKPVNTLSPAVVKEFECQDRRHCWMTTGCGPGGGFGQAGHLHRRRRSRGHRGSGRGRDQRHVARGQRPARAHLHRFQAGGGGGPRGGARRRARGGAGLPLHPRLATTRRRSWASRRSCSVCCRPAAAPSVWWRRVGLVAALPMLLTGKRIRARRAKKIGLVDAITTPGGIAETGARAALALADGKLKRTATQEEPDGSSGGNAARVGPWSSRRRANRLPGRRGVCIRRRRRFSTASRPG